MTITATPNNFSSVHGNLLYVVSETTKTADEITYPNYKYIADIYINGTMQARLKRVPEPVNNFGVFDIGPVIRNYINLKFNPGAGLVAQQLGISEFNINIQVKFGEEYAYTAYYNVLADTTRVYYNHYDKLLLGATSSLAAYQNKITTNGPVNREAQLSTTHYFINYFATNTTAVNVAINASNGTTYTTTITASAANNLLVLNIAPANLNTINPGLITGSTQYYDISLNSVFVVRVYIICEPVFNTYPIHFLNQYGGLETKLFTKARKITVAFEKQSFERLKYEIDNTGAVQYLNSNNVYTESKYTYSNLISEKWALNSDILTDAEYTWLYDLIASPMVYLQQGIYFVPVSINDTNYELKTGFIDGLTNLVINIDKTYNVQFR